MPRFLKLGHVALNVTDLERSRRYYEDHVGLAYSGTSESTGAIYLRCSSEYQDIALHQAKTPGLRHVGWEMETERELDELARCLGANEIPFRELSLAECNEMHLGRTIKAIDPGSGLTNLFYDVCWEYGGEPFVPTHTKIQRLGHILIQTPNSAEAIAFYRDVLGFQVSDKFGPNVQFMRCWPNPYHHSLGIGRSDRNRFNHVNFMVSEVDDIGKGMWRCNQAQVPIVHGPGRHPPSGSMFLYFLDPDGMTVEYSFGMEEFPEEGARKLRQLEPMQSSLDFWGAPIDPRKGASGEIVQGSLEAEMAGA